ncbi:MAG: metallophosphoesterase [Phycisphaerales bacterium]|nr:metallophosphoesterase [Phycisphaerales bacterium]
MAQSTVSKTRKIAPFIVLGIAFLIVGGYTLDEKMRPSLANGPMVHLLEPDTLAVTWSAEPSFSIGKLHWTFPSGKTVLIEVEPVNGRCTARLGGLMPGQTYSYRVSHDGFLGRSIPMSGPHEVSMPVPRGHPFRFLAFGDSGNGSNTQAALARLMMRQDPDVIIHVGDLVYPAGAIDDYPHKFYEPNAELIRSVPFMASLGNHDVATDKGQPLLDVFMLPENGPDGIQPERNYYFDYGDARFVALDSNRDTEKGAISLDQMKNVVGPWLRKVLSDCDARWKFVYFHHPFYTGSTHRAEGSAHLKEAFVDIFEQHGVDMVFWGHNHLYERTAPIRQDRIVPDGQGVVYIVTGVGGVSRYPEAENPPEYIRAYNDEVFSFTRVDLSSDRLELQQIDEYGNVIDEYSVSKPDAARSPASASGVDEIADREEAMSVDSASHRLIGQCGL